MEKNDYSLAACVESVRSSIDIEKKYNPEMTECQIFLKIRGHLLAEYQRQGVFFNNTMFVALNVVEKKFFGY